MITIREISKKYAEGVRYQVRNQHVGLRFRRFTKREERNLEGRVCRLIGELFNPRPFKPSIFYKLDPNEIDPHGLISAMTEEAMLLKDQLMKENSEELLRDLKWPLTPGGLRH